MTPEYLAETVADEAVKDESENIGLAYYVAQKVVEALRAAGMLKES